MFDIRKEVNFWVAFTYGHSYRITASNLVFGPYAKIRNFCNLENGILDRQSMTVSLTGELAPVANSFRCQVRKYRDTQFTMTGVT
jgi:hypothetical protein